MRATKLIAYLATGQNHANIAEMINETPSMRLITSLIFTIILIFSCLPLLASPELSDSAERKVIQKAVLVTGASSGIGRTITETLAANNYFVYAGARKQSDLDELNNISNVQAIRLDVTIQSEIDAAVQLVKNNKKGLYALVNNAGVALGGPLTEVDESDLKWLFDVNVYGPYRITQAFAPLIIESKGRITNISSISGILSGTFLGHYSMSKHAIEAYTDSLASEMQRFDVHVSAIEPGNYRSQIGKGQAEKILKQPFAQEGSPFAEDLSKWAMRLDDRGHFKKPDDVARAVMHALFNENPKRRYMVVPNQKEAEITIRQSLRELIQLNAEHPYSYSREELIKMLDEVTAQENK